MWKVLYIIVWRPPHETQLSSYISLISCDLLLVIIIEARIKHVLLLLPGTAELRQTTHTLFRT
jgi:hypothetical protein